MRGKHIHFYPVGLFGDNAKIKLEGGSERPVKTLNTLRKQFQEDTVSRAAWKYSIVFMNITKTLFNCF